MVVGRVGMEIEMEIISEGKGNWGSGKAIYYLLVSLQVGSSQPESESECESESDMHHREPPLRTYQTLFPIHSTCINGSLVLGTTSQ